VTPTVEGIYETQVPLEFRAVMHMGAVCAVDRQAARQIRDTRDSFELKQLNFVPISQGFKYLDLNIVKYIYIYHHKSGNKSMIGILITPSCKGTVYVLDTVRSNQMPNLNAIYNTSRSERFVG
jgi:DNA polymerase epsilon subunit 1